MNDFRDIKDKKMVVDFGHMAVTSGLHENHFGGVLRTEEEGSLSGSESEIEMRKWRYWNLFINFKDIVCERKQRETRPHLYKTLRSVQGNNPSTPPLSSCDLMSSWSSEKAKRLEPPTY